MSLPVTGVFDVYPSTTPGRLMGSCRVQLAGVIEIGPVKLIRGGERGGDKRRSPFISMPSYPLPLDCFGCGELTPMIGRFCGHCRHPLPEQGPDGVLRAPHSRKFRDVAHPICHDLRDRMTQAVLKAFGITPPPNRQEACVTRPADATSGRMLIERKTPSVLPAVGEVHLDVPPDSDGFLGSATIVIGGSLAIHDIEIDGPLSAPKILLPTLPQRRKCSGPMCGACVWHVHRYCTSCGTEHEILDETEAEEAVTVQPELARMMDEQIRCALFRWIADHTAHS